jgi:hypothetical protein
MSSKGRRSGLRSDNEEHDDAEEFELRISTLEVANAEILEKVQQMMELLNNRNESSGPDGAGAIHGTSLPEVAAAAVSLRAAQLQEREMTLDGLLEGIYDGDFVGSAAFVQGNMIKYLAVAKFCPPFKWQEVEEGGEHARKAPGPKVTSIKLEDMTIEQWHVGALRMVPALVRTQKEIFLEVDYRKYLEMVGIRACRYRWEQVRVFDDQYRQLQATAKMPWGTWNEDVTFLAQTILETPNPSSLKSPSQSSLITKRASSSVPSATRSLPLRPRGNKRQRRFCDRFNDGSCQLGALQCEWKHYCNICQSPSHGDLVCTDPRSSVFAAARQ